MARAHVAGGIIVTALVIALAVHSDLIFSQTSFQEVLSTVASAKKISDFIDTFPEVVEIHVKCNNQSVYVASYVEPDQCDGGMTISFKNLKEGQGMVKGKLFTVAIVDPDWPMPDNPDTTDVKENKEGQRLLQMVINVPGMTMKIDQGEPVQDYVAPNSDGILCDGEHDGEHRIAILVFEQMPPFEVVDYLTAPRTHFNIQNMLVKRVKQQPVGDFFFYTKCGGYQKGGHVKDAPFLPPV